MEELQITLESYTWLNNTAWEYILAFGIFVVGVVVLKLFRSYLLVRLARLAEHSKTDVDDALIRTVTKVSAWFYVMVPLYIGSLYLTLHPTAEKTMNILFLVVVVYEAVRALERILTYALQRYIRGTKKEPEGMDPHHEAMLRVGAIIVRGVLWVIALLLIASNLGFNVTSLVASLGIGGIAVALAVQNILGDLFSSFSLLIDKPFQIGDFIVIGQDAGTVKRIGMKTTRIATLRGEELVIPNKELTTARLQNFKKLERRREVFLFGVTYETDAKKLATIPDMLKEIINEVEHVEFDRCHFSAYRESNLEFEAVYFIDTADYEVYMDIKQAINLSLFNRFAKEKIEFAYPTRTIYVKK